MLRLVAVAILGIIVCQASTLYRNRRTGTAEHWCCDVTVEPIRKTVTTVGVEPHNVTRVINTTYQRDCKFGETPTSADGWLCEDVVSHVMTTTEMVEVNKTMVVEYPGRCPAHHLSCCEGYEKVGNQCIDQGASSALQDLFNAGLIG
eukprot:XP_011454259.1 PREDICTED: uncharacterized protein LOC105347065 [Crassostrea gigas]